jgi:hypothetical protein
VVNAWSTLFQAFEHQQAAGKVDAVNRQGQGLRQSAAGIGEGYAERPVLPVRPLGRLQEGGALACGEILPRAFAHVQRHASWRRGGLVPRGCPGGPGHAARSR